MSHIDSIAPVGPVTLAAGESIDIDVTVTGVPGDEQATFRATGSDGSAMSLVIAVDRAALAGITTGAPLPHEVHGALVSGPGTLESIGAITGGWRFRYTAV